MTERASSIARRKGSDWWLGAITDWENRELELSTKFLGDGEWKVEAFEDADDADVNAEHYVRREFTVKAGDPIKVCLAPGGGFAARFTPTSKASAPIETAGTAGTGPAKPLIFRRFMGSVPKIVSRRQCKARFALSADYGCGLWYNIGK